MLSIELSIEGLPEVTGTTPEHTSFISLQVAWNHKSVKCLTTNLKLRGATELLRATFCSLPL